MAASVLDHTLLCSIISLLQIHY